MAGNAFIKFSDVPVGESLQKTHPGKEGWIEISDWGFDIESETNYLKGTGLAVGKATPGNLSISHYFDISSTTILSKMVAGQHFKNIWIEMLKTTGKDKPERYFQVIVTEAYVTKVSSKGSEDGSIGQEVEFVFKEIFVGYKPQKDNGQLDGTIPFDWSVKKNTTDKVDVPGRM